MMNLRIESSNSEFEAEAQRLAGELQSNPAAAANELRNELAAGNLPRPEACTLAEEANRLAGPYSSHLLIKSIPDGTVDVEVVSSQLPPPAPEYYRQELPCYAPPSPPPYYPAPYYPTSYAGIGVPGSLGIGLPGFRINIPLYGNRWRRW